MSKSSRLPPNAHHIEETTPVEITITSRLFKDYLDCPTKCFLRASQQEATENSYANWGETRNASYRRETVERLIAEFSSENVAADLAVSKQLKTPSWRLAVNLAARAQKL
jgi:hypothetical protein